MSNKNNDKHICFTPFYNQDKTTVVPHNNFVPYTSAPKNTSQRPICGPNSVDCGYYNSPDVVKNKIVVSSGIVNYGPASTSRKC